MGGQGEIHISLSQTWSSGAVTRLSNHLEPWRSRMICKLNRLWTSSSTSYCTRRERTTGLTRCQRWDHSNGENNGDLLPFAFHCNERESDRVTLFLLEVREVFLIAPIYHIMAFFPCVSWIEESVKCSQFRGNHLPHDWPHQTNNLDQNNCVQVQENVLWSRGNHIKIICLSLCSQGWNKWNLISGLLIYNLFTFIRKIVRK